MLERTRQYIRGRVSHRSLLEGIAEECGELTQAAIKMIRTSLSDNPTPVTTEEAHKSLITEMKDVMVYMLALCDTDDEFDRLVESAKASSTWVRWKERLWNEQWKDQD